MAPPLNLVSPPPALPGLSRWAVLAQALRAQVLAGDWPPGTALPAEQALAASHGVALGTMRQALQQLVADGVIERIHGRGTFVRAGLSGASMLRFFRFGRAAQAGQVGLAAGRKAAASTESAAGSAAESAEAATAIPESRILKRTIGPAPADAARALGLAPRAPALRLTRLRSLHGQPCLWEQITLPLPRFSPLAEGSTANWDALLYPLYARLCSVHVHRALDHIGFGQLTATQARALGLPAAHPAAVVTRLAHDLAGDVVEHRVTCGDAHAFHYAVTIT